MFQMKKHSLVNRVVGLGVISTLITAIVIIFYVAWVFEKSLDIQLDNHLTAYVDVMAGAIRIEDGQVIIDEKNTLLESIPRHWQIDSKDKHIAKSALLKEWLPLMDDVSFEPERLIFSDALPVPLIAVRQGFNFPDENIVIITFGLEQHIAQAYKEQLDSQFRQNIYYSLPAIIFVLILIGVVQAYFISNPLRKIRQALQEVRSGTKDRIEGNLPSEVQVLSNEINYLLDYMDGAIKRHRNLSGNLSHALKTPLTVIRSETDSVVIQEQVDTMLQVINRNLSKTQAAGTTNILSSKTKIKPIIERISNGFCKVYQKDAEVLCAEATVFQGDETDLYEILGNLIENACKYGTSKVRIAVTKQEIVIEDDGSGVPEAMYKSVLKRGSRLDETKDGAGLGLSITKDIIDLYGGDLKLEKSTMGGLKVTITSLKLL